MYTQASGRYGELQAERYLESKGYRLICRNWTCRWGEIDLICKKDEILVFVEVKYRSSSVKGYPFEAVTFKKLLSLHRAIHMYLSSNNGHFESIRFDVITILKSGSGYTTTHYEGVSFT